MHEESHRAESGLIFEHELNQLQANTAELVSNCQTWPFCTLLHKTGEPKLIRLEIPKERLI